MLNLSSTSDKLQAVTTSAAAVDALAAWADNNGTTVVPGRTATAISSATTTDIVPVPGGSTTRGVSVVNLRNKSTTLAQTVTVQQVTGTGTFELVKATLLIGEVLHYSTKLGWIVTDANGIRKSVLASTSARPDVNGFRMTGASGVAIMTADNASISTLYLTPYYSNEISLYNTTTSAWETITSAEVSLAITGRTTDLPFDVFAYSNAGVLTIEFLDWTSANARATSLTRVSGVWTKTTDASRRYVGSVRARSATTCSWVTAGDGASASTKLDLFNADNRVSIGFLHKESTDSWAYTTATVRQARGSTNNQVDIMVGLQEGYFEGNLQVTSRNSTISIGRTAGIGFDSTTTYTGSVGTAINTVASINSTQIAHVRHQPTIGRHFYSWNEFSVATGTCTWLGDDGTTNPTWLVQSGITGFWSC
jgi:hypothetical protein